MFLSVRQQLGSIGWDYLLSPNKQKILSTPTMTQIIKTCMSLNELHMVFFQNAFNSLETALITLFNITNNIDICYDFIYGDMKADGILYLRPVCDILAGKHEYSSGIELKCSAIL